MIVHIRDPALGTRRQKDSHQSVLGQPGVQSETKSRKEGRKERRKEGKVERRDERQTD